MVVAGGNSVSRDLGRTVPITCRWGWEPHVSDRQDLPLKASTSDLVAQLRRSPRRSIVCRGSHDRLGLSLLFLLARSARPADSDRSDHGTQEDGSGISGVLYVHLLSTAAEHGSFHHGRDGFLYEASI